MEFCLCPCEASYQEEVVVLRLGPQVLEDDLLHEALHQVPVLHDPVTNRPLSRQDETVRDTTALGIWSLMSLMF